MAKTKAHPTLNTNRTNTPLFFLLFLLIPIFGGYYNFSILLAGVFLTAFLLHTCLRQGYVLLPTSPGALCLYGLWACYLLSIPFSVSLGMAFTGFLRVTVWLLLFLYSATYTRQERQPILDALGYQGALLSLFSTISFIYNEYNGISDLNGRIDGFFQYANTWALYQLICLLLLFVKPRRKVDYPAMAVLLCGLYLSGSRGVYLLLLLFGVAYIGYTMLRKGKILPVLLGTVITAVIGVLAVALSSGLVWDRLQAITLSSSSLNGRLLYWHDGLKMLLSHPLGVGRGGYLYTQVLEQTGVYTLRFIHNEYLQAALDAGILAGLFLVGAVMYFCFRRSLPLRERLVLFSIAAHGLIDFDFQFSAVFFLFLLCSSEGKCRQISLSKRAPACAAGVVLMVVLSFFTVVYGLDFMNRTDVAYRLYPADLELAEKRLQTFATLDDAEVVADRILEISDLSMLAWDCKFACAAQRSDIHGMVQYKYQYLRLNRYRGEVYQEFTSLLENAYAQGTPAEQTEYASLAQSVILQLEEVTLNTHPLAYKIVDKPELDFSEEILSRLTIISEKG